MRSGRSGKASTWTLVVVIFCTVAVGVGYYAGRHVLGEQYLKKQASEVRTPRPMTAPRKSPMSVVTSDTEATVVISPILKPRREPERGEEEEEGTETTEGTEETETTTPEAAPTPVPAETLTIQLGSFADKANAEILVQDLKQRGVSASTQATQQDGQSLHRVRTGTYKSRENAEAAAEALRRKGYNAVIVPK